MKKIVLSFLSVIAFILIPQVVLAYNASLDEEFKEVEESLKKKHARATKSS